jgi:hypothetical protein
MSDRLRFLPLTRPGWAQMSHPVYHLERQRRERSLSLAGVNRNFMPVLFGVCGGLCLLIVIISLSSGGWIWGSWWEQIDRIAQTSLSTTLAVLLFVQLIAGAVVNVVTVAQAAPLISGEVELRSWGLLRVTTVPLREIIFAKFAAMVRHLRPLLRALLILRTITLVTGLLQLGYLLLRGVFYNFSSADWHMFWGDGLWLSLLLALAVGVIFFVTQPYVQVLLNTALGMLASVFSRTRGQAVGVGLAARLALWIASILYNVILIYGLLFIIIGNWLTPTYATLEAFYDQPTPTAQQVVWALCLSLVGYLIAVMLWQAGFVLTALGLVQRRAHSVGP